MSDTVKHVFFVIYDGIANSVFQSQVLQPLLAELSHDHHLEITLISFEEKKCKNKKLLKLFPAHDRLHIILCKKIPFIGRPSLWFAAYQLKRIMKNIAFEHITARGPLAGYCVLSALHSLGLLEYVRSCTVQARGLCAEEYRYTYSKEPLHFWRSWWRYHIYNSLYRIEQFVYSHSSQFSQTIESVSPALKDYLVAIYKADPNKIVIAVKDIPDRYTVEQVSTWRQEVRQELHIPSHALVYCYSGSWRPWQCADKTIEYFLTVATKTRQAHLLILTADKEKFLKELKAYTINPEQVTLFAAPANQLHRYLAAADFGLLFREPDIINWVSRPTKMLEYQAVGLQIIHNNTVAMLVNR